MSKTVIGSGNINLDTIVVRDYPAGPESQRNYIEREISCEVGGTCGNVMTMLAHLGEKVYPIAKLDDSPEGLRLTDDFRRYGCDCRFITNTPAGGTTLLRCTHKLDKNGNHRMSPRAGAPGGSRYPKRRFMKEKEDVPAFVEALDFTPDVFFFDNPAAAHVAIATRLREKGTLVYFEPEGIDGGKVRPFLKRVSASDVIKFSGEKIADTGWTEGFRDKLFIQTMGEKGLRFNLRGEGWVNLPPVPVETVVDWEGAGDWTTTMLIKGLCDRDILSVGRMTRENITEVLQEAQKVASRSVGYMASKGMIKAGKI